MRARLHTPTVMRVRVLSGSRRSGGGRAQCCGGRGCGACMALCWSPHGGCSRGMPGARAPCAASAPLPCRVGVGGGLHRRSGPASAPHSRPMRGGRRTAALCSGARGRGHCAGRAGGRGVGRVTMGMGVDGTRGWLAGWRTRAERRAATPSGSRAQPKAAASGRRFTPPLYSRTKSPSSEPQDCARPIPPRAWRSARHVWAGWADRQPRVAGQRAGG